jgi:hypothetical protein
VTKVVLSRVSIVSSVPVSPPDFDYNAVLEPRIDAEAVGGLTSDQVQLSRISIVSSVPVSRPTGGRMATRRLTNRHGNLHSRQHRA